MQTIVVGDIHGCYEELLQLLAKAQLTEYDYLISLGDIVDRQTLSYSQEIVKLQFGDRYEEFLEWVSHRPYYHETDI